jgi:YVTN family beta-propeller protein
MQNTAIPQNPTHFLFERFLLDTDQRSLFKEGARVPLTRKEYQLLLILVESAGDIVPKDELMRRLWPQQVAEEGSLFAHIRSLRNKLGPSDEGQRYIENVHGLGYRFTVPVRSRSAVQTATEGATGQESLTGFPEISNGAVNSPTSTSALAPLPQEERRTWLIATLISLGALVAVVTVAIFVVMRGTRKAELEDRDKNRESAVVILPEAQAVPRLLRVVSLDSMPRNAVLAADGKELYVSTQGDRVLVVDTKTYQVTRRIYVGPLSNAMALTPDKKKLYVAMDKKGLAFIDIATKRATAIDKIGDAVEDLAITPDSRSAYLALGFNGLAKADLAAGTMEIISKTVYAEALALTPDGRRLYVSYQAGGPGGSPGHDALGYFDTATDQLEGVVPGKYPNVGGCVTVAPDGSQVWENGGDACSRSLYDHVGCPFVPGGLLNVVGTGPNPRLRSLVLKGALVGCATFAPSGDVVLVTTQQQSLLMRSKDARAVGYLPRVSGGKATFTPDGALAYIPLLDKPAIAVVQVAVPVRAFRMTNLLEPDGTFQIAIAGTPEFDAIQIDPMSLRIGKQMAKRTVDGNARAALEGITRLPGTNLVVYFSTEVLKVGPTVRLEGSTFGGIPIRATLDTR